MYFRNASIIIGPHGSAFSNLVWCKNSVKVIELNSLQDVRWHFALLSHQLGFEHYLLLGEQVDENYFKVDKQLIENKLDSILL